MRKNFIEKLVGILVVGIIVLSFFGVDFNVFNSLVDLYIRYALIGAISSLIVRELVEAFTGVIL